MTNPSEEEWGGMMRSALAGDQAAYRKLLTAIAPHVRGVARRNLLRFGAGGADLEDIVQETLLAVHLKRATWRPDLPFVPWLNAVTRHKAIDAYRRKGNRVEIVIEDVSNSLAAPESDVESSLDVETVLASLESRQRSIVEQVYLHGHSAAEVGAAQGMTEGAVRVALHRALKVLATSFNGSAA